MVDTGIGARRLFVLDDDVEDVALAYPTLRLVVGYAFQSASMDEDARGRPMVGAPAAVSGFNGEP